MFFFPIFTSCFHPLLWPITIVSISLVLAYDITALEILCIISLIFLFLTAYNLFILLVFSLFFLCLSFTDFNEVSANRILGIDVGVRNIITIGNSISEKGIAVKGGVLKSINQYFNRELARLKSVNDRQRKNRENTKRINKLYAVRNRKIRDVMHKISSAVIVYARTNEIDTIVIGHNNGWKQDVDMGKKNNQDFVQIPFNTLINQIYYKGQEYGINVIKQEESYTSKCSFLDNESIEKHETYLGKRIKRGVFKSSNGKLIHADLQASYNIIKKAIPEAFANGIEGIGLYPSSLSIKDMITSKEVC